MRLIDFCTNSPALAGLFVMAISVSASAAVPVTDASPAKGAQPAMQPVSAVQTSAAPAVSAEGSLYHQLELLQQEVQSLRGLLEEQSYELKKLKAEQRDRYIDVDRRITQLSASKSGSALTARPAPSTSTATDSTQAPVVAVPENKGVEKQAYSDAFALIKARNFDAAVSALQAFLGQYPSGPYAGNAQYWLGEVYLATRESKLAQEAFAKVLSQYPGHRKTPDASYKLGRVYAAQGDKEKAREYFELTVKNFPDTPAANLSSEYLKKL